MPYEVRIDFDEASEAWLRNKVKNTGCVYSYICGHMTKQGTRCMNKPLKAINKTYCYIHTKFQASSSSGNKRAKKMMQAS